MSPYHFLRAFKEAYGETPNELLIRHRLEQAKKCLLLSSLVFQKCVRKSVI
ncbi:hypothetical protein [Pseudoalteromonas luteoviolacea]